MKTIIRYGIILILFITLGCSKDDIEKDDNFDANNYVRAKVGEQFKTFSVLNFGPPSNDGDFSLWGYKDKVGIRLRFPDSIGIYSFEEENIEGTLSFGNPWSFFDEVPIKNWLAVNGEVTVTSTDDFFIKGTFYFTAENYIGSIWYVSEGEFIYKKN